MCISSRTNSYGTDRSTNVSGEISSTCGVHSMCWQIYFNQHSSIYGGNEVNKICPGCGKTMMQIVWIKAVVKTKILKSQSNPKGTWVSVAPREDWPTITIEGCVECVAIYDASGDWPYRSSQIPYSPHMI